MKNTEPKAKLIMYTKGGGWYVTASTATQRANGWGKLRFVFIAHGQTI